MTTWTRAMSPRPSSSSLWLEVMSTSSQCPYRLISAFTTDSMFMGGHPSPSSHAAPTRRACLLVLGLSNVRACLCRTGLDAREPAICGPRGKAGPRRDKGRASGKHDAPHELCWASQRKPSASRDLDAHFVACAVLTLCALGGST